MIIYKVTNKINGKVYIGQTIRTLNELERYYIQKYDSINTGYNMVDGGGNNVMFIPEIKEKHRLKMQSEETRKKISDTMKKNIRKENYLQKNIKEISHLQ